MQNSLAAALEISSWLRGRGMKKRDSSRRAPRNHQAYFLSCTAISWHNAAFFGMRIGVMGTPSSWLIASNVDYLLAKRRWGIEYTDVSLDRIYEYYGQITDDEVGEACAGLAGKSACLPRGKPRRHDKGHAAVSSHQEDCRGRATERHYPQLLPPDRPNGNHRLPCPCLAERRRNHCRM